jgi:hypothetical protein
MDEFEKILDASRDFFSSPEEESEVVAMVRRDPDAILSGKHKPFMKKLAEAIIRDRPKDFRSMDLEMLKAKIASLEDDLRDLRVEKEIIKEWAAAYAAYPDPCKTSIPLAFVEKAANAGIADAQYYLYFMLGQQCIFDRFWHIKVKWLRRAAEQGHVEAIKRYANREHTQSRQTDVVAMKEDLYWMYKLVEIGKIPEIEFLEFAARRSRIGAYLNTSYAFGSDPVLVTFQEVKLSLKRLMTSQYAEGSPGYERCKRLISSLMSRLQTNYPSCVQQFDAI